MAATTDQKARLLDLTTGVLELVRDGKRDIEEVSAVLQMIKNDAHSAARLVAKKEGASWPVWKTLTVGGVPAPELLKRLQENDFYVSKWAKDIMGKPAFITSAEPYEVTLIQIKVADLGFKKGPTTAELFARAKEHGLDPCPAEVGPHLRLADADQPNGTWYWYWIAMEPITDSAGVPCFFSLGRYAACERWLFAGCAGPGYRWGLDRALVFRLGK